MKASKHGKLRLSVFALLAGVLMLSATLAAPASAYNRTNAVYYADLWWNGNNPSYPYFGNNDCTNFVSQVLDYGGLPQINHGYTTHIDEWWHYGGLVTQTWSVADKMYQHANYYANQGTRFQFQSSAGTLNGGDFILMDLNNDGQTVYSHARIGVGWLYSADYGAYVYMTDQHSPNRYHVKWDVLWNPNTQPHKFVSIR